MTDTTSRGRVFAAALLAGLASGPALAQETTTVRVGVNAVVSDVVMNIADEKGFFKEQGLKVEFVNFDSGPKMVAPLASGQIDVGAGASSVGLFNAAARDLGIKIVADKGSSMPGYSYMPLLVRKDLVDSGRVKSIKDLKDLSVAEAGRGGSPAPALDEVLRREGLSYDSVRHVYNMGYPQQVSALANKAIDAAFTTEPSATQAVEKGYAVRFANGYPHQQIAVLLFSGDFIKNSPEVARKFMVAYIKGARFFNDAVTDGRLAGPAADEVIAILGTTTGIKDEALFRKMLMPGIDPNGRVNVKSLQDDMAFYQRHGFLENPVDLDKLVDTSFVEAAVKQLGEYAPKK
ncbi:MAG TPA: ABC transporter substrate-binding protein [Azospirillum sp.]|nr:ABC transporter substrate-binding protein [Azospirillum sp.]